MCGCARSPRRVVVLVQRIHYTEWSGDPRRTPRALQAAHDTDTDRTPAQTTGVDDAAHTSLFCGGEAAGAVCGAQGKSQQFALGAEGKMAQSALAPPLFFQANAFFSNLLHEPSVSRKALSEPSRARNFFSSFFC